jgi:CPA1 family monovalent cation:H+ antiporter
LHAVYQTVIFVLESVVFSLIGLELPTLVRDLGNAGHWLIAALAVSATLIATRVAWVFPAWAITQRRRGVRRPSWPVPAVVSWAGTRGVVPLAAALSIPLTTTSGAPLPQRDLVLVLTAATIVISLIVQGFTLEPLARFAGFGRDSTADPRHEETVARLRLAEAGLARLDELAEDGAAPDAVIDRLRDGLQARIGKARVRLDQGADAESGTLTERELRGDLIAAENAELARLFEDGSISAATRQRLQRGLDLELARLTEGHR